MKHNKRCNLKMILFEMRNIVGNPYVNIFGVAFPIFLGIVMGKSLEGEITDATMLVMAQTSVILSMGTIIPLATIFMGYACQYSQELEKGIPTRMLLFGYKEKYTIINRVIVEFIFMTASFVLYFSVVYSVFPLVTPSVFGVFKYFAFLYVLSVILFILSHGIASLIKKFSATYAVVMILYFGIMILSGMMGIRVNQFPRFLQITSKLIPFYYYSQSDFLSLWKGESYNYGPLFQALLFCGAISGIVLFIALNKTKRKLQ